MRLIGKVFLSCLAGVCACSIFFLNSAEAQVEGDYGLRGDYKIGDGSSNSKYAEDLLDRIVGEEKDDTGIIQTDLDQVDNAQGSFGTENKISSTLDATRYHLADYIQWLVFIGLAAAVALIVYNGVMLVFSPLAEDQVAQVKKRMMYIIAGTLLITGFYFVMKILLSILLEIISKS